MKILFKIRKFIFLFILFVFYLFINANSYVNAISNDISKSVFRLHVIANSNSEEDQNLKYKVRDNVLKYMQELTKDVKDKNDAINIAKKHTDEFKNIAQKTIIQNGFDYNVNVKIGNFYFPTKSYGDISLPAGDYDALRIEIGKAEGKNWWCVMFPPLCFVDVSTGIVPDESKEVIKDNLSNEEYSLISNGNNNSSENKDIKFKFKLIELLNNSNLLTAKK